MTQRSSFQCVSASRTHFPNVGGAGRPACRLALRAGDVVKTKAPALFAFGAGASGRICGVWFLFRCRLHQFRTKEKYYAAEMRRQRWTQLLDLLPTMTYF
ncbi:hypothetical protein Fuma_03283 [Fuerstiella marisgermanici]|uniref:Uncharacterized protein n=1 Tax=Fuerstiella marisgermanici TaxID=1891926 RepID=A0A1P8WHY5_9PLAN|nr:hypothetical protein Fuma_03283 [Fuerstiella marisgermanici]